MIEINPELIRVARQKKYQEAEGFLDKPTVLKPKFLDDVAEIMDVAATELSKTAGVSFHIAWETLIQEATIRQLDRWRDQHNR